MARPFSILVYKEGYPEHRVKFEVDTRSSWASLVASVASGLSLEEIDGLYDPSLKGAPVQRLASLHRNGLYFARPTENCALLRSLTEHTSESYPAWPRVERGRRARVDLATKLADYSDIRRSTTREPMQLDLVPLVPDKPLHELLSWFSCVDEGGSDVRWGLRARLLRKIANVLLHTAVLQLEELDQVTAVSSKALETPASSNLAVQYACWSVSAVAYLDQREAHKAGMLASVFTCLRRFYALGERQVADPTCHLLCSAYMVVQGFPEARNLAREAQLPQLCVAIVEDKTDDMRVALYACWLLYELLVARTRPTRKLLVDRAEETKASPEADGAAKTKQIEGTSALDYVDNEHDESVGLTRESENTKSSLRDEAPALRKERDQLMEIYKGELFGRTLSAAEKVRVRAFCDKEVRVAAQILSYGLNDMEARLVGSRRPTTASADNLLWRTDGENLPSSQRSSDEEDLTTLPDFAEASHATRDTLEKEVERYRSILVRM